MQNSLSLSSSEPESEGMTLDQLSRAFASMLEQDESAPAPLPVSAATVPEDGATVSENPLNPARKSSAQPNSTVASDDPDAASTDDSCPINPKSILEATLFVGRPDNVPLTSQQIADMMRGVTADEIDRLIHELNQQYAANACPYCIVSEAAGYRMILRSEHAPLRDRFYGRIRTARLSPAAIEVLAMVAYREPLSAEEVTQLRGIPSGHLLRQLVQRRLLRLERGTSKPRKVHYFTTPRFLEVFGLSSLNDLPRSDDLARR